jgi:hypothetical protein
MIRIKKKTGYCLGEVTRILILSMNYTGIHGLELLKNARGQVSRVTGISCMGNSETGHCKSSSHTTRGVKLNHEDSGY